MTLSCFLGSNEDDVVSVDNREMVEAIGSDASIFLLRMSRIGGGEIGSCFVLSTIERDKGIKVLGNRVDILVA